MSIGQRLGDFEISAVLGEGGMGRVWRATDTRLGRDVALKMLPPEFAADDERHARFEREARTLAALNHPNIATLHGLEHAGDQHVLVMELVEGEGLDEVISRGPVPLAEAIPIAIQIADALEAAHRAGIVHRDLKPANIRIRPDGTVKVLDFGLAKTWRDVGADSRVSLSPTVTTHPTAAGVILGTAAYMAPEQARGRPVDGRADLWSLGVVLLEMLTGRRQFEGETVSDVLAQVLTRDIDLSVLRDDTPVALRRLLRRCLERDPARRLRDPGDAILELRDAVEEPPGRRTGGARSWVPGAVVAAIVGLAAVVAVVVVASWPAAEVRREAVRFHLPPAPDTTFELDLVGPGPASLSPDGLRVAFTARSGDGSVRVWIRDLGRLEAVPVPGTDSAQYPFWSADGRSLGFIGRSSGKLHRVDLDSGRVRSLAPANNGKGGTWNADGVIVYAPGPTSPLYRVSSEGGDPAPLTTLDHDADVNSHRHPRFLADGNRFLYLARSSSAIEGRQVRMGSLDGSVDVELMRSSAAAVPVGDLLLAMEGSGLVARRFDPDGGTVGESLGVLATGVSSLEGAAKAVFDATRHTLVFLQGAVPTSRQLRWYPADGTAAVDVGPSDEYLAFALAPDGDDAIVSSGDDTAGTQDLWLADTATGLLTRLTSDPGEDMWPVFEPHGQRVFFSSNRGEGRATDSYSVYSTPLDRSSPAQLVAQAEPDTSLRVTAVTDGGRWIVADRVPLTAGAVDIVAFDLHGGGDGRVVVGGEFDEMGGAVSPDRRWLAFVSREADEPQIFVTPFPDGGRRWRVSRGGGMWPTWRRQDTLVYQALDGRILAQPLRMEESGPRIGSARELTRLAWVDRNFSLWDVTDDLSRVLSLDFVQLDTGPMVAIRDWRSLLRPDGRDRRR